jgi:dehydrogenase/reductase SDR family member 1
MSCGQPKPLDGKVALVTGASRGVGRGVALALAREGALVYLTARSYEENEVEKRLPGSLQSVKSEIQAFGGR